MMQITNNFGLGAIQSLQSSNRPNAAAAGAEQAVQSAGTLNPLDQVDFSSEAQALLAGEAADTENRTERIADIRRQIADGSYDSDDKVLAALDRFLDIYG